ncbi:hypothetical protein PA25_14920 [Pseudoalteromonas sp. A25]|uniref:hypothetical protein n=1 Tax=Pseudoalteromonas sp. A25 TaxID=116092 RepID=UPI0012607377|nr:hypothetical protein [Pseudoalteromonas sp. A25]BBN81507.1 hypothetical protein PA25_14920 [Pseudoalteromonas sp. A25]
MKYLAILLTALLSTFVNAATSPSCPGEEGYFYTNDRNTRNPSQGGFVSHDADISDNIWLGRNAAICGFSTVSNGARITGRAVICGDALVKGRKARVTGHAKVCGDARVDGSKNEVVLTGHYETFTGLYSSGTFTAKKKIKQQSNDEYIKEFLSAINKFSSVAYTFTEKTRKLKTASSYEAYQDNIKDSCEIVLTEIRKNKALRDGRVASWPKKFIKSRFNLRDIYIYNISVSGNHFDYDKFDMYQFSFDLKGDKPLEGFVKKQDPDGAWQNDKKHLKGYWLFSEKKSRLQKLHVLLSKAVKACN